MELSRWVEDQLHDIIGFAERNTVDFVISVAKRSRDEGSFLDSLRDFEVPINDRTKRFAVQLLSKVPRSDGSNKQQSEAAKQKREERERQQKQIELLRKNESYKLVEEEPFAGNVDNEAGAEEDGNKRKRKDESRRHVRKKKSVESSEGESDNDDSRNRDEKGKKKEEDPAELLEQERLRDLEERDAFAERLRVKEDKKTRKIAGGARKEEVEVVDEESKEYRPRTHEERREGLKDSRVVSRQLYLHKREGQKLKELVDSIKDEELLFEGEDLTEREQKDWSVKKKVLELVEQRDKIVDKDPHYVMPEDYDDMNKPQSLRNRYKVLDNRYEEDTAMVLPTDDDAWQQYQVDRATSGTVPSAYKKGGDEYEFLIEDQVDFIRDAMGLKGDMPDDDQGPPPMSEADMIKKSIEQERASLPIYAFRPELLQAIQDHQVLIIVGETGSGKTTQIPQYLHEDGYTKRGKVCCTQPRRVAAMSVAKRVSDEMGVKLGNEVGYKIRFEDATSEKTQLVYMTDGMMLREFLGAPDMGEYSVIMVDEAHERTLHTDILFGLVKDVARFRPDLKLLISSATLEAQKFSEYFDDAPVFNIPGRRYNVDIFYTKAPEADYLEAAVVTVLQIHVTQPRGDILVFMPGQEEIEAVAERLTIRTKSLGSKIAELLILPIYSSLPSDMQAKIFDPTPPGARKVVVSTNIAETSLTIDGIIYVIDPGFCKQKSYNPRTGMEALVVTQTSKASAQQRTGRAGRTAPGKCFRLYTAWAYKNELPESTVPEIQRTNLGNVVLVLKSLGIEDLAHFDFMDPPPPETIMRALEQLYALGALNAKGELTKTGRKMAEFPLDPMMAKMLIKSEDYGCSDEICTICSMLSVDAIYYRPKEKQVHADNARINFARGSFGDHIALLSVYNQWKDTNYSTQWCFENFIQVRSLKKARDVRDQLLGLFERTEVELKSNLDTIAIRKAITSGYFHNCAMLQRSGNYRTIKKPQTVFLHPQGALFQAQPPVRLVVYHELVKTSKDYLRTCSEIERDWLIEIAPHRYQSKDLEDTKAKLPKGVGSSGQTQKEYSG